jgi:hypothetical protein
MAQPAEPPDQRAHSKSGVTLDHLREIYGPLVRPSPADFNAPSAVAHIIETFEQHGVVFSSNSNVDQLLRFHAAGAAAQSYSTPDHLLFQDPTSRQLLDRLERVASQFGEVVEEVWEYGLDDAGAGKLNLCEGFFPDQASCDAVLGTAIAVIHAAQAQKRFGIKPRGRGRQPLYPFYDFTRRLHAIYSFKTEQKGFYEKDGTAVGDFIDLVFKAQSILPREMRHSDIRTVGNRILEAFKEKNKQSL